jgi:hypothetical protein
MASSILATRVVRMNALREVEPLPAAGKMPAKNIKFDEIQRELEEQPQLQY